MLLRTKKLVIFFVLFCIKGRHGFGIGVEMYMDDGMGWEILWKYCIYCAVPRCICTGVGKRISSGILILHGM